MEIKKEAKFEKKIFSENILNLCLILFFFPVSTVTSDDESDSGNDIEISVNMFTTLASINIFYLITIIL